MSINKEEFEEYLNKLADIYSPEELVIELGLTTWDLIEAFREKLEEQPLALEKWRHE